MTDPIADMLTRIRNSLAVKKHEVVLPMSKIKYEVAKILEQENWIRSASILKSEGGTFKKNKHAAFDQIKIVLKYKKSGKPAISNIKRISKPGLRIYVNSNELPVVLNNLGMAVISTSKGLMTNRTAKKNGLGGEVICELY